jgi:hypothetical protein
MSVDYVAPLTRRVTALVRTGTADQLKRGVCWYEEAHGHASELAAEFGYTTEAAAGVIAALSPQTGWWQNLMLARQACELGELIQGHTGDAMRKVNTILADPNVNPLDALGGLKVRSFYRNIVSGGWDREFVTIDRHAYDIATGVRLNGSSLTPKRYEATAETYRRASKILGMTPAQAQATAWVIHRDALGIR